MKTKPLTYLLSLTFLFLFSGSVLGQAKETIISKADADHIFSLTRNEWEEYAKKIIHPLGWEVRLYPTSTGTGVMSGDPNSGIFLAVQPVYYEIQGTDNIKPPNMLRVGSYYPPGTLPEFTDEFKNGVENASMKDLGPNYLVSASYADHSPLEGIMLTIIKKRNQ